MWFRGSSIFLLATIISAGCRSPQKVLDSLQHGDPCFATTFNSERESTQIPGDSRLTIEDCVNLGLQQNPAVIEAQYRIDAIRQRVPQAMSLPDPMVNTNTFLAPVQTAAGEQQLGLGISQKITNAERRATAAAMVCDEVAAAEANLEMVRLDLAESIRTACYQLMFIRDSIEIVMNDQESLGQISEVILRQYEVKKDVTQQDVLNIQIEQSAIENQLTELRQQEKSFQARLARLLHLSPSDELTIDKGEWAETHSFDIDMMIERAIQLRPDLQMQLATINRDRKKVHLAGLENKPDFTVGLNWIATSTDGISPVRNGDDTLILGIGFNLPVYKSRIQAGIREAIANRHASTSRYSALQDKIAEEVFDLIVKINSNRTTLELLQNDIIPKAERTLALAIDEYSTSEANYVQLIENWRSVLKYRIAEANLKSQSSQYVASLTRAVGQLQPLAGDSPTVPRPE